MMTVSVVVAVALVLAQALAVLAFLRFVKSFGAFTESNRQLATALLTVHESNLMVHQANQRILDEVRTLKKAVA